MIKLTADEIKASKLAGNRDMTAGSLAKANASPNLLGNEESQKGSRTLMFESTALEECLKWRNPLRLT